ncbi:MAG: hypothetical protein FJ395_03655 [Verrucomicrobia bacterium]|nr:hypothetical protein [Verrucomicrobiota bacterium]
MNLLILMSLLVITAETSSAPVMPPSHMASKPKNPSQLAPKEAKTSRRTASELAANTDLLALWDPNTPFPSFEEMPDLGVVTHVQVERAQRGEFHFLHESAIAWHGGVLHIAWANHPLCEDKTKQDQLVRGRTSRDGGLTWNPVKTWVAPPFLGGESYNHPVLKEHQGTLWGFFTRWEKKEPRAEIFALDDTTQTWQPRQSHIPKFIPFTPPRKMRDGNWILGGELFGWREAAVAISHGNDFTRWDVVPIPRSKTVELMFPETTIFERGDELIAICRPKKGDPTAQASLSRDCGRTWTPLRPSNFPMVDSKPLCGRLSTGQQYLISNSPAEGRTLLSIAVTAHDGDTFRRIWKIRHQATPVRRLLGSPEEGKTMVGTRTEWSYPAAIETGSKLYISYTQGKEDCAMSIIPLSALEVHE